MAYPIRTIRLVSLLLICAMLAAAPSCAGAFDSATWSVWHATWHGPNALATPLRGYFIPRLPGRCDRPAYAEACGNPALDSVSIENGNGLAPAPFCETNNPLPVGAACLSVRFERLGEIPNDLDLGGSVPVSPTGR